MTSYTDWMGDLKPFIWNKTLKTIAMPGSHDAGTYSIPMLHPSIAPDAPPVLRAIYYTVPGGPALIARWSRTQRSDIYTQLANGARAFDFRVARNESNGLLHICHALYGGLVFDMLDDIADFLNEHTKEVVILLFNAFYAMQPDSYESLRQKIESTFGGKLIPRGSDLSLSNIWGAGQQVLVVFTDADNTAPNDSLIWPYDTFSPTYDEMWPNAQTVQELLNFDREKLQERTGYGEELFWLQGQLTTPSSGTVDEIVQWFTTYLSLENVAHKSNPIVTSQIKYFWVDDFMNVVGLDFFDEYGGITDVTILVNTGLPTTVQYNTANNNDFSAILQGLYFDTTLLSCPKGKIVTGFQLVQSAYELGFETNNRIVPVLTCTNPDGTDPVTVCNTSNNSNYVPVASRFVDSTPIWCPQDSIITGFQFVASDYQSGFETNNRIVPVLTCMNVHDSTTTNICNKNNNSLYISGIAGLYVDTTPIQSTTQEVRGVWLEKTDYNLGFETNNRIAPVVTFVGA